MRKQNSRKFINLTITALCILVIGLITFAEDNKVAFALEDDTSFDFYRQSQVEPSETAQQESKTDDTTITTKAGPEASIKETSTPANLVINHEQTVTTGGETVVAVSVIFIAIVIAYIKTKTKKSISVSGKNVR